MDVEKAKHDEQKHLLFSNRSSGDEFIQLVEIPKKDEYPLEEDKMGMCFIINNVDREQPATRKDVQWCIQVFRNMGFDVKLYLNQTKEDMRAIRHNEILNDENYKDYNCLVVLVISHGSTKRNILAVDNTAWNLDTLEQQISGIKSLQGKPKLLFVDACRGKMKNLVQKSQVVLENGPDVAEKDIGDKDTAIDDEEEEEDEDLLDPIEVFSKNIGTENKSLEIDEKKGASQSSNEQRGKTLEDLPTMAAKRDQFIGMSTVENFLALTVQTVGSPYLQFLMSELGEDCFLKALQTIHQTTRKKVATDPIPKYGYIVADEHNRLHKNLQFSNFLFRERRGSQPLMKGCVSYESKISLLGNSYNLLTLCPAAHLDLTLEETKEKVQAMTIQEVRNGTPKSFYNFLKESTVKSIADPPQVYMELFNSTSECFKKTSALLQIRKNHCLLDSVNIGETLVSTKSCPGFNVKECGIKRFTVTFHKEFPMAQVTLTEQNQKMLQSGNVNSINTSNSSFKIKIEKWIGALGESAKDGIEKKEAYERFLDYWGHHFVTEFYQGGSVTITLLLTEEDLQNVKEIKEYLSKICSDETMQDLDPVISSTAVIDVEFHGGNIEHHRNKFSEINDNQMKEWKKSLLDRPVPLISKLTIQPTHLLVGCLDSEKGKTLQQVSEKLLKEGKNWSTLKLHMDEVTATYTGETKDGKAQGQGTMKSNLEEYSGGFKEGKKSGHGKGHFKSNVTRYASNLCFYQGEWLEDRPQGNGEGHFNKGDIYIGQWKNGNPEGLGTVYYRDGKEAMVICKEGFVEKVVKGDIQDKQVGTSKDDFIVQSPNVMQVVYKSKWLILSIITTLLVLIVTAFLVGLYTGEKEASCTETIVNNWKNVSQYHEKWGVLDISMSRLKKIDSKVCQTKNVFFDFFPIEPKTNYQKIKKSCTSYEIPQDTGTLTNFNTTSIVKRLHDQNIIRLRTCDPQEYNCSDIGNSRDIQCKPVQYRPLSCVQALASQWDTVTNHNKFDNTLTADMTLLPNATRDLCQLDKDPVTLEIFAISPNAEENLKAYYSCQSYSNGFHPHVVAFGEKMTLKSTGIQTLNYVSGSFVFRFSRDDTEACTFPVKGYQSEKAEDIIKIWESAKCKEEPTLVPIITTTLLNTTLNPCHVTIPNFPLPDCYLFDEKLTMTATMIIRMANETHKNCDHKLTSYLEIWDQKNVKVRKRTSQDKATTTLEDVTFNLLPNATFCLEVFLDYPLCPSDLDLSRNEDDISKCSGKVNETLQVINCEKK